MKIEKGIEKRGKSYRIRIYRDGVELSKTVKIGSDPEASLEYARRLRAWMEDDYGSVISSDFMERKFWPSAYQDMYLAARKRDGYELTRQEEQALIARCQGCCEVTGLPFRPPSEQYSRNPYGPSLDRIDSSKGYTPDNVRIVCVAANLAMNEWGEEVLSRIAKAYVLANTKELPYNSGQIHPEFSENS